ncbi:MAG: alpha-2-macroglobulin family protein [Limimaricola sp.]|uniref:alpha-2-macroglobulin family protein n=1 Tax=Limimaricola sp. TaxID=2211665 RepID=UPI001D596971|nr:alpha-2-macroglobulin family protein [Limimaricola sp.]MBI1418858.1 alpha-2-macroglobulin family protein [Limimaricola sp.]
MRFWIGLLSALMIAGTAMADPAVPARHIAISRDVDFPGGDLRSIFDTTLDACQAACLNDNACTAFTFNTRSNSCFPKADAGKVAPYQGAISARVYQTDPRVLRNLDARTADLSFLSASDLDAARSLALRMGRLHSTDESMPADLLAQAHILEGQGDLVRALAYTGAALAVSDRAEVWLDYARLARTAQNANGDALDAIHARAVPAAVAGYLRALDPATQVSALAELAQALEVARRGHDMIPALKLAQQIRPRADVAAMLDDAIGKYGFRVTDTQVESDSASPRICAVFSETLVKAGVDYAPFVQLPDPGLTVEVNDNQLCIDGVEHGTRYRVVLRQGLPAANGETLTKPVELTQYVRDRSPSVRFTSRAYVLPRLADIAIPLETVNLTSADLVLRRMSDRNLIRTMQDGTFTGPLYPWDQRNFDDSLGEVIWKGSVDVARDLNRDVLTRVPLSEALKGAAPGVYVLTASVPGSDGGDNAPPASQWFILSDLGIATMKGTDGLTVAVKGLGDAQPVAGADVTLLSEGNAVLGTTTTDAEGVARFAAGLTRGTGAAAPALVSVKTGDDAAFLSLRGAAFDLSDRGVTGREAAGPIDIFLATDRGAYRAGEDVHLTALMRDPQAHALPGVPLTAILTRPDGVEYSRITSTADVDGGHVFDLPIAASAPRGTWSIAVKADVNAPPLATRNVLVEDFLPERIDFSLALPATIRATDRPDLKIDAHYLFGAKAGDLAIEGEALLRATTSVDAFPGYVFGRYDDPVQPAITPLTAGRTAADGTATVPVTLPDITAPGQPLSLRVTARLSEGGRPVERQVTAPVLPATAMIGIRPASTDILPQGATAKFSLIGLAPDLTPTPMAVKWTLNRVETRYTWYQQYGSWNWEPVTTRTRIATGTAQLGKAPVEVSAPVDWGKYELVVERTDDIYVASSVPFTAGWYAPADAATTPDLLEAGLDKPAYAPGDTATLRIVPRYAGTALVSVMSDHLIAMKTVQVSEGENLIQLPVTDDWGAGAYVTASVIRPMDVAAKHNPARSLGLAYAQVAPGDKALGVTLDSPDTMLPRGPMDVGIHIDGIRAGETAHFTLAAVDVGILNLTAFKAPDPQGYYFGQRKLGMDLRDIYGDLIDGMNGAMGTVRSGGDAMAQMRMQAPPPTEKLVAFFQGPVTVDADGNARVSFDMPAFNGTVRLMAVAWSATGVGQASRDVVVRDPVVVTSTVPRFLAPGDQSRILIDVVHADGPAGTMGLSVTADGLALASTLPRSFTLTEGGKQSFSLPLAALDPGTHTITVTVTTPDGKALSRTVTLPVEVNDPAISRQTRLSLAPGQTFNFDDGVFTGLVAGTGSATLSVGPLARLDAPGLLRALDLYPYGCTEQLTSKAMPLLYFDQVAQAMGEGAPDDLHKRVQDAITAVLANQDSNGAFGLWGPDSGDGWLDAYVTDFLSRARAAGYDVPALAFSNALDNLRNEVNYAPDFDSGGEALAYQLMVLAREGAAAVGDLRYYADQKGDAFTTPTGAAQLGAALAYYGDQTRADAMFARAAWQIKGWGNQPEDAYWRDDYGTDRRDAAAVLALASEAGSTTVDRAALLSRLTTSAAPSTQEAAWSLLAAHAMIADMRASGVTLNGQVPDGPMVRLRDAQTVTGPVAVANGGSQPVDLTVTTFGVPSSPEPAGGNGYKIERQWFTMDGQPVDVASVPVGTRLVAVLTVTPFGRQEARLMVTDPLPAGFEIDNPNLIQAGEISALTWLDPARTRTAEFLTDRFLAAVDWESDQSFRLAYIVRAVSPGNFHLPAASVEDMYRPRMRARSDEGRVTVTE